MKPMSGEFCSQTAHEGVLMSWFTTVVGILYPTLLHIISILLAEKTKQLTISLTKFFYFSNWYSYTNSEDIKSYEYSWDLNSQSQQRTRQTDRCHKVLPFTTLKAFSRKINIGGIFLYKLCFIYVERCIYLFTVKKGQN